MELRVQHETVASNLFHSHASSVVATLTKLHYAQGEKRLMLAVLLDALDIIAAYHEGRRSQSWGEYQAAVRWIMANDHLWPFSFENICYALDLDRDRLRAALQAEFPAIALQRTTQVHFSRRFR
jgi:hypothetical protein